MYLNVVSIGLNGSIGESINSIGVSAGYYNYMFFFLFDINDYFGTFI